MKYDLLLAEDITPEREALRNMLKQHWGHLFNISEAEDGSQALALVSIKCPDIAILNIEMPGASGLEVARKIRSSGKPCVILFISDFDSFSYAQQAITLRAMEYILKPYEEETLVCAMQQAVASLRQLKSLVRDPQPLPPPAPVPHVNDPRLAMVREDISSYISSHFMEELSMKNVARAMNYSDAYFCKLFKQCFQVNFSTYLNEFRIRKAQSMLENPRVNIKNVGWACGYSDPNYFSRVFKRITGQTPSEYRLSVMDKIRRSSK